MSRNNLIFMAILTVCGYYLLYRPDVPQNYYSKTPAEPSEVKVLSPKPEDMGQERLPRGLSRKQLGALYHAGVSIITPKHGQNNQIQLDISYEPHKLYCQVGEYRSILRAVQSPTRKELLLSVENLMDRGQSPVSIRLSTQDLKRNHSWSLSIPVKSESQLYGLFLCHDPRKKNRCAGKPLMDFKSQKSLSKKTEDLVFSFHKMNLSTRKIELYSGTVSQNNKKAANRYLNNQLGPNAHKLVEQSERIEQKIASLPLEKRGQNIVMKVSMSDMSCLERGM